VIPSLSPPRSNTGPIDGLRLGEGLVADPLREVPAGRSCWSTVLVRCKERALGPNCSGSLSRVARSEARPEVGRRVARGR